MKIFQLWMKKAFHQKQKMDELQYTGRKSKSEDNLNEGDDLSELEGFAYGIDECVETDESFLNMAGNSVQKENMDEMQGTGKKSESDGDFYEGDHLSELEDFTYGTDECVGTEDALNMAEKSVQKENMDELQGTGKKSEVEASLYEGDYLSEPEDFIYGIDKCVGTDEDILNTAEKTSDRKGNMDELQGTGKKSEAEDNLYEGDYLSELEDFTYGIDECVGTDEEMFNEDEKTSDQKGNMVETKSEHEAGEKLASLQAEMAKECKQENTGDKGPSPSNLTRSCCLNCFEASLKLRERNILEFSSKQLLLQEGDTDFCRVNNGLGQNWQKQLTYLLDLQHCTVILEEKIKEMEVLLLQEGGTDWDRAMQEPEHNQKKQRTQIMDLYYNAVYLDAKIRMLGVDILKQLDFFDTITSLKRSVADLTEAKNKATEEKESAESCLQSVEEALASTKCHLKDCEEERSSLMLQLKKFRADICTLQEQLQEEVEQKTKYVSHCVELDSILHRKEQEIQQLSTIKNKLEEKVSGTMSSLQKMNEEKDSLEKHITALQAALQRQKDEGQAEKKELVCKYNKLIAQIKILQVQSENEQGEMEKMQQQIHTIRMENGELQQRIAKNKSENNFLQAESARWKEQYDQIRESQSVKEKKQYQIIKGLRYKLRLQQEELRKKEETIAWKMHILGRLHLDMKSVHSDLSTRSLCTEENNFDSPGVQKVSNLLAKLHNLLALTEGLLTSQVMQNSPFSTGLHNN